MIIQYIVIICGVLHASGVVLVATLVLLYSVSNVNAAGGEAVHLTCQYPRPVWHVNTTRGSVTSSICWVS